MMPGVRYLLVLGVMSSALASVYGTHRARVLFTEIQRLQAQLDAYEVEWGKLQLEQQTWAAHARIERIARENLDLVDPEREAILYLKLSP